MSILSVIYVIHRIIKRYSLSFRIERMSEKCQIYTALRGCDGGHDRILLWLSPTPSVSIHWLRLSDETASWKLETYPFKTELYDVNEDLVFSYWEREYIELQ